MDKYVSREAIPEVKSQTEFLRHPNLVANRRYYLGGGDWGAAVAQNGTPIIKAQPNDLLVEALHLIGNQEPKTVLDIGTGNGRHSLLLAELGHYVVATDNDPDNLEYVREQARDRGISNENFVPRLGKLEDIHGDENYQIILGMMVLHFLRPTEIVSAAGAIHAATAPGGLNIVNAYTKDNPSEEITERGLKYMFSNGELARLMFYRGSLSLRNKEGVLDRPMPRNFKETKSVLFPTVAEVISQKLR
jgi:2-polyprenyl-3-methyl-5-hydroxy-6-metoxy-1,4-benzoquinol methylase